MTINTAIEPKHFSTDEFLWANRFTAHALVRSAVISQTEAHLDMVQDFRADYPNRDSIQDSLAGIKNQTKVLISDLIDALRASLLHEVDLMQLGAIVTGLKYDLAGDYKDVEVDVTINWE